MRFPHKTLGLRETAIIPPSRWVNGSTEEGYLLFPEIKIGGRTETCVMSISLQVVVG